MKLTNRFLKFDHLNTLEKRAAILIGLKWSDKTDTEKTLRALSSLRKKLTPKAKRFNGTRAIRKWRDLR